MGWWGRALIGGSRQLPQGEAAQEKTVGSWEVQYQRHPLGGHHLEADAVEGALLQWPEITAGQQVGAGRLKSHNQTLANATGVAAEVSRFLFPSDLPHDDKLRLPLPGRAVLQVGLSQKTFTNKTLGFIGRCILSRISIPPPPSLIVS